MKLNTNDVIEFAFSLFKNKQEHESFLIKEFECSNGSVKVTQNLKESLVNDYETKNGDYIGFRVLEDCCIVTFKNNNDEKKFFAFSEIEEAVIFSNNLINLLKA